MKTSRPAVCRAGDDRGQLDHIASRIEVGLESPYRSESYIQDREEHSDKSEQSIGKRLLSKHKLFVIGT
ncbi:hypothetical protein OUZ56_020334 [Daphnia magna]|uniref:Uncharacterized protein n=1 Tax=Daphnia magna TaxID=35525 RepID=A0ABQ9ZE78_9CRUS|nr:hypothetical protein OUZ56_020334 [Daphnia magna]